MKPKLITIHCSASPNGKAVTGDEIKRWHIEERGWKTIGYHAVIEVDGGVYRGRPDDMIGAHVAGQNGGNLGVCMVGNDLFSKDQFASLYWVITTWMKSYGIESDKIFCHYEWDSAIKQGKTCPNIKKFDLVAFIKSQDYSFVSNYILGNKGVYVAGA